MKHLFLAPFLLGFISPLFAENLRAQEMNLSTQEILQRPLEDEKGWLKTKGSTSEWLEVKNWDNDEWWINSLATLYNKPIKKIKQKKITEAKLITCKEFILLEDYTTESIDSCKTLYKGLSDRAKKRLSEQEKAFYEDREWHDDILFSMREKEGGFKLFIHLRNRDYSIKKGWFNDQFVSDWLNNVTGKNIERSKRELLGARIGACRAYASGKRFLEFPTLGIYVNCLELAEKWKAINQTSIKNKELNTSKPSIQNSDKEKNHEKCLKAADYKGCMRYQNK